MLAAGRGSKARQGEATQGARHCRVRPGECNTKTSKQGRARQQRTRRANTKQHKARQGKTRQGKERVNNDNTEGEREERARRSKARRGKTEHGKGKDNGKTRQGTAPCMLEPATTTNSPEHMQTELCEKMSSNH